jgi:hypothetical protein
MTMKLTKQQLRNIIKEELTPGEKGVIGARLDLHPALSKAIQILASTFVRVNANRSDEVYVTTLAERLIDGIEELVFDLEDEFNV